MKKYVAIVLNGGFIDDCSMKIFNDSESANTYIIKLFVEDLLYWFDNDSTEIMNEIQKAKDEIADGYIGYNHCGKYHEYYVYVAEEV